MSIFYSPQNRGFYDDRVNPIIPSDSVEISKKKHMQLLQEQSQGGQIVPDPENGMPIVVDTWSRWTGSAWEYDFESWLDRVVRPQRDAKLLASDKYIIPDYPIDQVTRDKWLMYRQALRDFPSMLTEIVNFLPWPAEPA